MQTPERKIRSNLHPTKIGQYLMFTRKIAQKNSQLTCDFVRRLLSVVKTLRWVSVLVGACHRRVLTWYSMMASPRSSARSHATTRSPSSSESVFPSVVGRLRRDSNLRLISQRVLVLVNVASPMPLTVHTHLKNCSRRSNSSVYPTVSPSAPRRSSRASTDSIFLLAGDF